MSQRPIFGQLPAAPAWRITNEKNSPVADVPAIYAMTEAEAAASYARRYGKNLSLCLLRTGHYIPVSYHKQDEIWFQVGPPFGVLKLTAIKPQPKRG